MSVELGGPWQVGLVVPKLEPAMEMWWEGYGVGPWKVWNLTPDRLYVKELDGEPAEWGMRIAITQWGPTEFELIEPYDDDSIYARSLREHDGKAHVHHLHITAPDYDGALDHFASRGQRPLMNGGMLGSRFAYMSTEPEIGTILEIGWHPEEWDFPEPDAVYPPEEA